VLAPIFEVPREVDPYNHVDWFGRLTGLPVWCLYTPSVSGAAAEYLLDSDHLEIQSTERVSQVIRDPLTEIVLHGPPRAARWSR